MNKLLDNIEYPSDLRKLKIDELPALCDELRQTIVNELAVQDISHQALAHSNSPWQCTTSITHQTTALYGT